jgi:hypothetical protein
MGLYRKITGLRPQTSYKLVVSVDFATNAPADCGGIGGSPGTSVYFKLGAVNKEPLNNLDNLEYLRINLDKGNQAGSGIDMQVVGHIGNTLNCPDHTYQMKTLTLTGFQVTSSADGTLWILLGTDSGFEGKTVLYYDRVTISLTALS